MTRKNDKQTCEATAWDLPWVVFVEVVLVALLLQPHVDELLLRQLAAAIQQKHNKHNKQRKRSHAASCSANNRKVGGGLGRDSVQLRGTTVARVFCLAACATVARVLTVTRKAACILVVAASATIEAGVAIAKVLDNTNSVQNTIAGPSLGLLPHGVTCRTVITNSILHTSTCLNSSTRTRWAHTEMLVAATPM